MHNLYSITSFQANAFLKLTLPASSSVALLINSLKSLATYLLDAPNFELISRLLTQDFEAGELAPIVHARTQFTF